jgi:hypothetical protein
MGQDRIGHDAAWVCSTNIMDKIKTAFLPAEVPEIHELIYRAVKVAISTAFLTESRENLRLKPGLN